MTRAALVREDRDKVLDKVLERVGVLAVRDRTLAQRLVRRNIAMAK